MSDLLRALTIVYVSPNADGKELYETRTGQLLLEMYSKRLPYWSIHGAPVPHWSLRVARSRVDWWLVNRPSATEPLFLLGSKTCSAFGINDPEWLMWYFSAENSHTMIAFPHPRMNSWWHEEDNAERAAKLLNDVATGKLPLPSKPKKVET